MDLGDGVSGPYTGWTPGTGFVDHTPDICYIKGEING